MLAITASFLNFLFAGNGLAQQSVNPAGDQPPFTVAYTEKGFSMEFEQSEYQFIPSKEKIEKSCIATAYQLSESAAEKQGRPIYQLKSQDIRLDLSRNALTGNTNCLVKVTAYWKQSLSPF